MEHLVENIKEIEVFFFLGDENQVVFLSQDLEQVRKAIKFTKHPPVIYKGAIKNITEPPELNAPEY